MCNKQTNEKVQEMLNMDVARAHYCNTNSLCILPRGTEHDYRIASTSVSEFEFSLNLKCSARTRIYKVKGKENQNVEN